MYDLKKKGEEFSALLVPALVKIISTLQQHGKEVFIIGGAVRDFLCGYKVKDFDVATNAVPEQIIKWLQDVNIKTKPIGGKYGTVLAIEGKNAFDISTYRKETFTTYNMHTDINELVDLFNKIFEKRLKDSVFGNNPENIHDVKEVMFMELGDEVGYDVRKAIR